MADCVNVLKWLTVKATMTNVFDSTVDEFTEYRLFVKVVGRENIAFIGFPTVGDGY